VLEIIHRTGQWQDFERWKEELAEICDTNGISLWDFSSHNMYTSETPPSQDDKESVMEWYWESGHYRSTLGERVLAAIFNGPKTHSSFGKRLTRENLGQWLLSTRRAAEEYRKNKRIQSDRVKILVANQKTTQQNEAIPQQ
jgi:hypothetical protein